MPLNNSGVNQSDVFECTMCGKCCRGYGGTYINTEDVTNIASHVGISRKEFTTRYTQHSGNRIVLTQKKTGFCVFWNEKNGCLIHPVKPNMCKQWPLIRSVLIDIRNWIIMASSCPGMKINIENGAIVASIEKNIHKNPDIYN